MKCKVCNHELIPGSRQCPHCGAAVPDEKDTFVSEFKWNIQDYPKPKNQQKQNISIDWKSGRILDENSGKIYDQSLNEWAEPEEIRDLFTFDTRNERRQQTLDREMDRIFKGSGKSSIPHSDTPPVHREKDDDTFHLPSSMKRDFSDDLTEMHRDLFSGLFRDNPDDEKDNSHSGTGESEPGSILSREKEDTEHSSQRKETKKEDSALHDKIDFHEHSDEEKTPEKPSAPESSDNLVDDFIRALHNISGDIYGGQHRKHTSSHQREDGKRTDSDAASSEKSSGSPSAPASEGKDIPEKKAVREKKTSESPETHPSPETSEPRDDASSSRKPETEKPESEKKDHIPESDSEFSGFSRLIEAEKRFKDDMEKVTFLTPAEYEEAEKAETKSEKLRFVPTISFRTIEDEYEAYRRENENAPQKPSDEEKGVQISINEPSGTKVTVKTQEISLASLNDDPKVKTREVRLDDVKQSPKNVQVSVEVNAAQGNASVEVTRRHDGATVVKTVDKSDAGHIYIDGEDKTDYSEGTADRSRTVPVSAPEKTEKAEDFSVEDAIRSGEKKESVAPETIADADSVLDDLDEKLTDDTAVEPETEETAETNKENEEKDTEQPADEDADDAKEEGSDEDDGKIS